MAEDKPKELFEYGDIHVRLLDEEVQLACSDPYYDCSMTLEQALELADAILRKYFWLKTCVKGAGP